ncbi:MAG: parallel beta-helix domain-containing protein, partial [Bacteroidota bacterium]
MLENTSPKILYLLGFFLTLSLHPVWSQNDFQKKLQTQLIMAENGAKIQIPAGTYQLNRSLSLENKENVIIEGAGMGKTILSFKNQVDGAEGLRINSGKNITIQNLSIEDAKGDCIKAQHIKGMSFKNVKVAWTGKPNKNNGAYGLYPVSCENVLIESCEAVGASDAGIYVGQSRNIVVRNCKAYKNVAGIEIENSIGADVYQNEAYDNTGGILVFDLPDLEVKKGGQVRVYNNLIKENNRPNFAPKGNIVAGVPQGTGLMILATSDVEVFNNKIIDNITSNTSIISYFMTDNPIQDSAYYPFPDRIYIHDNEYHRQPVKPTSQGRIGELYRSTLKFGKDVPDIVWDGIIDPSSLDENGRHKNNYRICIRNNGNATFANLDAGNNFKQVRRDLKAMDCQRDKLK